MRKHIFHAICILGVLVVLVSCLPLSAFAVDPVSATVIANSFAQAIAAYGASNGVAMTFDVGSTEGIGETVHELWSDFRAGTQDADDYDTLAAALFPNLYYKALLSAGTAAEAYTVGVSITSEYAEEFDNFYNWLLSGPAEMVQVDNQYYQFAQSQIGSDSSAIVVYSTPSLLDSVVPYIASPSANASTFNSSFLLGLSSNRLNYYAYSTSVSSKPVYVFVTTMSGNTTGVICSTVTGSYREISKNVSKGTFYLGSNINFNQSFSYAGVTLRWAGTSNLSDYYAPYYSSYTDGLQAIASAISDPSSVSVDSVGVKSYTDAGIADIPDTADPNYDALNRAKDIPLNIPWDDTMFGDGSDALTGQEAGAIAGEVSGVLVEDQVIPLAEDEAINPQPPGPDDPSSDPDDYIVPGLADIFPFCIPFDIYNFLSALAAAPVAPHFTATLDFPEAVGGTQTIDIDFDSPTWNQLAQLLRLLELLAFIIGLALLTRSMFIRG